MLHDKASKQHTQTTNNKQPAKTFILQCLSVDIIYRALHAREVRAAPVHYMHGSDQERLPLDLKATYTPLAFDFLL